MEIIADLGLKIVQSSYEYIKVYENIRPRSFFDPDLLYIHQKHLKSR